MPAKSRKQFRWFKAVEAVEAGDVKAPGLSPREAGEMVAGQSQIGLPERYRSTPQRRRDWRFR